MTSVRVTGRNFENGCWTRSFVINRTPLRSSPQRRLTVDFAIERPRRTVTLSVSAAQVQNSTLPDGLPKARSLWRNYETILCLAGTLSNDERDRELARLESFLLNEGAEDVNVNVKGPYKLAYPIKKNEQGIYALFTYTAKRLVSKGVEYLLSHPEVGTEDFILRYKTFAV